MTETVDAITAWRTETLPGLANGADILRSFERLRLGIALDTAGTAGCFAGYERLEIKAPTPVDHHPQTSEAAGEIVLAAFVVHGRGRTQRVHYSAFERATGRRASTEPTRLIAEAVGLTVALPVAATVSNDRSACDV